MQSYANEWLRMIASKVQKNMLWAIFEKKLHKGFSKILENCTIEKKMDKIKSTSAKHTMEPKFE